LLATANLIFLKDLLDFPFALKKIPHRAKYLQRNFGEKSLTFQPQGVKVKVKFTLHMENITISSPRHPQEDEHIDRLTISWISDVTEKQVLSMSGRWISTKDFLTQRMTDLKKVGESSLTIEPVEELTPD